MDFGRTGHSSSRLLFGAAALGSVDQETADKTIDAIVSFGINHIDVAASYGKGEAEKRLGPWMERKRDDFFLATKTGERRSEGAARELNESLERLRTDHIDMIQLHNLVDVNDWNTALGAGGALEALIAARDEGMVRYIGVTGHGFGAPAMHVKSLDRFPFDAVLLPYNYLLDQRSEYAADVERLFDICRERRVAVQTIKSIARRPWQGERSATTWYDPIRDQDDIELAVGWVLGNEQVFLNTAGDVGVLPLVLEAATSVSDRPNDDEMEEMVERLQMQLIFEGDAAKSSA